MARTRSFTLGEHFEKFIAREVDSGRYASASEVMREAMRLMETRNRKIEALTAALIDGEESGFADDFDLEDLKARGRQRLQATSQT